MFEFAGTFKFFFYYFNSLVIIMAMYFDESSSFDGLSIAKWLQKCRFSDGISETVLPITYNQWPEVSNSSGNHGISDKKVSFLSLEAQISSMQLLYHFQILNWIIWFYCTLTFLKKLEQLKLKLWQGTNSDRAKTCYISEGTVPLRLPPS